MDDDWNLRLSGAAQDYMDEHDITQPMVAKVLGRSQNYVSGRLIGRHHFSADIIMAIAMLAHVPSNQLTKVLVERAEQKAVGDKGTRASPDPAGASG